MAEYLSYEETAAFMEATKWNGYKFLSSEDVYNNLIAIPDELYCKQLFLLFNLLFAFCVFVLSSEVCAGLGNGCERFCTSRSLLGSYVHQKSI